MVLQEQGEQFVRAKKQTLIMRGIIPAHDETDIKTWKAGQDLGITGALAGGLVSDVGRAAAAAAASVSGVGRMGLRERGEEVASRSQVEDIFDEMGGGDESYGSDFESIASDQMSMDNGEARGTAADGERERLHAESVRLIASELSQLEKDPCGRLLEARERSAREKRDWASQLLGQKKAIVERRRRENLVVAEERRTEEMLERALRLNVDEEARNDPALDEDEPASPAHSPQAPGTPSSMIGVTPRQPRQYLEHAPKPEQNVPGSSSHR